MKKRSKFIIVRFLLIILQFSGIFLAMVLEYLSTKKMGVGRYLVYKKDVFAATIFTPNLLKVYTLILLAVFLVCLVLLIVKARRGRKSIPIILGEIYNLIGFILISSHNLNAYPFFLLGIFIVIIFQYTWICTQKIKKTGA